MMAGECLGCFADSQPVESGVAYTNGYLTAAIIALLEPQQVGFHIAYLCERHRDVAAKVMQVIANRNNIPLPSIMQKFSASYVPRKDIQ